MWLAKILFALSLVASTQAYCQGAGVTAGTIVDKKGVAMEYAELVFSKAGASYRTVSTEGGNFSVESLPDGIFSLEISQNGMLLETQPTLSVNPAGKPLTIICQVYYCPFENVEGKRPACVNGHRSGLIPVAYGLPGPKMLKKVKAGKIRLGVCEHRPCEPSYYCPIHDKEL